MLNLEDVKGKLDCMDNRFASKYVEKIMIGMVAMILAAFMAGVIGFVFAPHTMASMIINTLL
jgi:ABC-type phosphate/phosphonate transport system permease subunit